MYLKRQWREFDDCDIMMGIIETTFFPFKRKCKPNGIHEDTEVEQLEVTANEQSNN